jgi:hypothetical protein
MGMHKLVIARLINPQAMNMFEIPSRIIHGVIAKGIPILIAFRRKAIPVNASPTIFRRKHILVRNIEQEERGLLME